MSALCHSNKSGKQYYDIDVITGSPSQNHLRKGLTIFASKFRRLFQCFYRFAQSLNFGIGRTVIHTAETHLALRKFCLSLFKFLGCFCD